MVKINTFKLNSLLFALGENCMSLVNLHRCQTEMAASILHIFA